MPTPFTTNPYRVKPLPHFGLEFDLRRELNALFYGSPIGPKNGYSFEVILRKVDKSRRCFCWSYAKLEADPACLNCSGTGFLTYDKIVRTIKRKYIGKEEVEDFGLVEYDTAEFFFEHSVVIDHDDRITECVTDDNGKIKSPVKYIKTFSIKDVEILRGENGRVEFIRIYGSKGE